MKRKYNKMRRQLNRHLSAGIKFLLLLLTSFMIVLFLISQPVGSQSGAKRKGDLPDAAIAKEEFFIKLSPYAQEVSESHGIKTSVLLAQAALESNWGESQLARESNNYFGIKSKLGREYPTAEYTGDWQEIKSLFKEYENAYESVIDYANLLKNGTSWDANLYQGVLEAPTYQEAAYALADAGYATDPTYAEKIIQMIEQYQLNELDEK